MLDVMDKRDYFSGTEDPMIDNKVMYLRDKDGFDLMTVANVGDGTNHGATVLIRTAPLSDYPGLLVWNGLTNAYFGVGGDGTVGMGLDLSNPPVAQLDIRKVTSHDYMLNVANDDNTLPYFNVHEDGNVGIGLTATSSTAKLSVRGSLDLYYNSSTAPALRIKSSTGTTRHLITDDDDNLIIDPGIGGGANDNLVVNGEVIINGSLTIKSGIDNQFKVGADGKIRAREVQVDLLTIPDYVFDKKYELPTIEELQTFIEENKHLPNIPSECEYEKRGAINIAELNVKLLEKVEELSLYIIQLNDRIKILENEK